MELFYLLIIVIVGVFLLRAVFCPPAPEPQPLFMVVPYEAPSNPGPGGIGTVILLLIAAFLLIAVFPH